MHKLIGALVYADDEEQALREASSVFSQHAADDYAFFILLDLQSAIDFSEFKKKIPKNVEINVSTGLDPDERDIVEIQMTSEIIDYSSRPRRYESRFIPVGGTELVPVPAILPANDPNALRLMKYLMYGVKLATMEALPILRDLLKSKTDEELFDEAVKDDAENYLVYDMNRLTKIIFVLWGWVNNQSSIYDPFGSPIRTQGMLDCILKGKLIAFFYDKKTENIEYRCGGKVQNSTSKVLSGESPFDSHGDTRILLNHLPQWLVLADAYI